MIPSVYIRDNKGAVLVQAAVMAVFTAYPDGVNVFDGM